MERIDLGILAPWIPIMFAATLCIGCNRNRESDTEDMSRVTGWKDSVITELARQHGAVTDWASHLPDGLGQQVFTVDLQRRLIDSGHPVLIRAELVDVLRTDGQYIIVFSPSFPTYLQPSIHFKLRASEDIANKVIMGPRPHYVNDLAAVAKIEHIFRPPFTISGSHGGDGFSAVLESEAADFFIAEGEALEVHLLELPTERTGAPAN